MATFSGNIGNLHSSLVYEAQRAISDPNGKRAGWLAVEYENERAIVDRLKRAGNDVDPNSKPVEFYASAVLSTMEMLEPGSADRLLNQFSPPPTTVGEVGERSTSLYSYLADKLKNSISLDR